MKIGHTAWSGQRSPVLLVGGIWGMFSKAKGSIRPVRDIIFVLASFNKERRQPMNAIVSTLFH